MLSATAQTVKTWQERPKSASTKFFPQDYQPLKTTSSSYDKCYNYCPLWTLCTHMRLNCPLRTRLKLTLALLFLNQFHLQPFTEPVQWNTNALPPAAQPLPPHSVTGMSVNSLSLWICSSCASQQHILSFLRQPSKQG